MKIIYVGPLNKGGTCLQRMRAMRDLGHEVTPVDTAPEEVRKQQRQLFYRLRRKILAPPDLAGINEKILQLLKDGFHHILWIDKGLTIKAETLQTVKQMSPQTIIAGYSPDDMLNRDNQSRQFIRGLPYYDVFFTTKSYGVGEIKELGCRQVEFVDNAYDHHAHRPMKVTNEDKLKFGGKVGFVGTYERERAELILYLVQHGFQVRVWGEGWDKKNWLSHPNIKIEGRPLWGDDYSKAICSFDINLCFLRKINRDLQTTRSVEIPACSGFMLAERTDEHLALFEESKEAEFFGTKEELLEKVTYYLIQDAKRRRIAAAGRQRCLNSGYSNQARMEKLFRGLGYSKPKIM